MNKNSTIAWKNGTLMLVISGLQRSKNAKTGNMVQSYILRSDISPLEAMASNQDRAICGDCPLKGTTSNGKRNGRTCYVNVGQGPQWLFKARKNFAGNLDDLRDRFLRLGSYGDPAFVPMPIWQSLVAKAKGHTGYTHQWRKPTSQGYKSLLMASCESLESKGDANALGWRTFRVMRPSESIQADEVLCPASIEAGKRVTCEQCRLCCGTSRQAKNVAIYAHSAQKVNLK